MADPEVEIEPALPPPPAPLLADQHVVRRIVDLVAGLVVPGLLLIEGSRSGAFGPEWQTGHRLDFGLLILNGRSLAAIAPLLIYSVTCLALVIVAARRFADYRLVRFGVYSGLILTISIALLIHASFVRGLGAWEWAALGELHVACVAWLLAGRLRWPWWPWPSACLLLLTTSELLLVLSGPSTDLIDIPIILGFIQAVAFLLAAPWIATLTFARYSWQLCRSHAGPWQLRLLELLGITSWCAAFMGAWRFAYLEALDAYSQLPSTDPNCYIATAAARGHRRFVKAQERVAADGTPRVVNRQLARLKAGEIALVVFSPGLHRATRAVYDRLGPPIARRLRNRWLADAAYLSLKPAEWCATWILRRAVPDIDARSARLFD